MPPLALALIFNEIFLLYVHILGSSDHDLYSRGCKEFAITELCATLVALWSRTRGRHRFFQRLFFFFLALLALDDVSSPTTGQILNQCLSYKIEN